MTTDVSTEEEQARLDTMKWLKQPESEKDYLLHIYRPDILMSAFAAPLDFDLRNSDYRAFVPPGGNQTSLGSCVYWSTGRGVRYAVRRQGFPDYDISELFGYFEGRKMRGWIDTDSGSYLRDAMDVWSKVGAPDEQYWPYDVSKFKLQPPQSAYANALDHQVTRYVKIPDGNDDAIDAVLAAGYPVCFGIPIYSNFPMGNGVGVIPNPTGQVIGGHAMMWIGYNKNTRMRPTLNQWGEGWGEGGIAQMSYDYSHQAQDLWYIETTEGATPPPPPPPPSKIVDGIGIWTRNKKTGIVTPVVHLWPPKPYEEMEEAVGGIGVHFTDGTIADTGLL